MLVSISIKNYALIEELSINFSNDFSVITGETGAGKSILLGALGLVLGKRADLSSLKNSQEKCVIETCFDISNYQLEPFFKSKDFDFENQTIIRREILPSGKSRAFVNDSPVNLNDLSELSDYLIDIHSQHQTRELFEEQFQFQIVDNISNNSSLLEEYQLELKKYKKIKDLLKSKQNNLQDLLKEQDYNTFLFNELLEASLLEDEQETLESLSVSLSNVELIKEAISKVLDLSNNEQIGVLTNLKEVKNQLQKVEKYSTNYSNLLQRVNSVLIELKDVVLEVDSLSNNLQNNPEQLLLIDQKLQIIYSLQRKHQVSTIKDLLEIQFDLEKKVVSVSDLENEINLLNKEFLTSELSLNNLSDSIYKNRVENKGELINQLQNILQDLGMKDAQFKIEISQTDNFYSNGKDVIEFLFTANKGSEFGKIKKVASGGEMSRIMLAIKAIMANYSKLPTIIFDEIDTGVSGEVANKIGVIMKNMSNNMQVFAITHLPQIASKGKNHFKVYKEIIDNQTFSKIKNLNETERVIEIAQMLSGNEMSETALIHARELLN